MTTTTTTSGAADLPKALRLAAAISNLLCSSEAAARTLAAAADELARLHAESEMRRAALLDEMQKAALAAGQATAAPAEPDPTPGDHPPPCDSELFESGVSVGLFDIPKWTAEALCKGIAAATGARVDWHYIAGRVHVKALPAPTAMDGGDAARLDWIAVHGSFGVDSATGEVGGNGQKRIAATRKNIDAARKQGVNHDR